MPEDRTPTEQLEDAYVDYWGGCTDTTPPQIARARADFHRLIDAHDREVREQIAQECEAHATASEDVLLEQMRDPLPGDYIATGNTDGLRLAARLIRLGAGDALADAGA